MVLHSPRKNFPSVCIPANGEGAARDLNPLPGSEKLPTTTVPPKRADFSDQIYTTVFPYTVHSWDIVSTIKTSLTKLDNKQYSLERIARPALMNISHLKCTSDICSNSSIE